MSGPSSAASSSAKPSGPTTTETAAASTSAEAPAVALEEDDEFEDFPVEDWGPEDSEGATGSGHLWEESWDDDDTSDDFSRQLKEELDKVKASSGK